MGQDERVPSPSTAVAVHTVSDLASAAGVSVQTIREWERRGHLSAQRTPGGQRRFDDTAHAEARRLAAARRRRGHTARPGRLPEDGVELARTGARIRTARLAAGLSQSEAARRIGVSRSFLSTVERGQSGVSAHVLSAMADVFGIPMGEFGPDVAPTAVLHPDDRPRTVLAEGVTWEELVTPGRAMEPALLYVPAGQASGGRITRPGETFVFMLDGALDFDVDGTDQPLHLGTGDALLIDAATAYQWHNPGTSTARCLWVEELPGARGRVAGR
jgi:transcriptional regulator with XRE-family HTH domain